MYCSANVSGRLTLQLAMTWNENKNTETENEVASVDIFRQVVYLTVQQKTICLGRPSQLVFVIAR